MLGDCHIHMVLDGVYYKDAIAAHRAGARDDIIRPRLEDYARRGITWLRDGGDAYGAGERARALAPEYGITYRTPTFNMCLKGRYGAFIGRTFETLADYRALVAEVKARRGDFIKLMVSGLMDFDRFGVITSEPLTLAQMKALFEIAHGEGFSVMAHANGADTVKRALEAGVDSVEHSAYLDDEAVAMLAQSGAVWVPTLVTIGNLIGCGRFPDGVLKPLLALQMKNVAACARLGGRIALGSDAGAYRVYHGQGALDEYALLKRALGDDADDVLREGEACIRRRF
ncbi:MAG: amidohydrolase family protein [Clostridia bacterium]|nr:amidohydrolase family protein [Clostridia bacterium]